MLDLDVLYQEGNSQLYDKVYNESMEWGTYKPNQFFGIKNRAPNPVVIGMIWAGPNPDRKNKLSFRHTYKYLSTENITAYYEYHDGWSCSR